ncbi:MAG: hypothetical protein WC725_03410 [Patescibacteria group bacterium]|jgi:hypothetical protein
MYNLNVNVLMVLVENIAKKSKRLGNCLYSRGVLILTLSLFAAIFIFSIKTTAATPPPFITYQGRLYVGTAPATTTLNISFTMFDAPTAGTAIYTASGTVGVPAAVSTTPVNGLFTVYLGDTGTNALDPTLFQNNSSVYLEVVVNGETLLPRKRIISTPFAFNAKYLDGIGATSAASTSAYIPVSDSSGNFNLNKVTSTGLNVTGQSSFATSTFTSTTVANGNITNLIAGSITTTNFNTVSFGSTNATFTNVTSTNISGTNANLVSLTSTNQFAIGLAATNFNSVNATSTNSYSSNFGALNLVATNVTSTNIFSSGLSFTNLSGTSANVTNVTTTNFFSSSLVVTNGTITDFNSTNASTTNLYVSGLVNLPANSVTDAMIFSATTWNAKLGPSYPALATSSFLYIGYQALASSTYLTNSYSALATSSFLGVSYPALATSTFLTIANSTSLAYLGQNYPSLASSTFLNQNYTAIATTTFVSYAGANSNVDLGSHGITFLNATGTSLTSTNISGTNGIFANLTSTNSYISNLSVGNCVGCSGGGGGGAVNTSTGNYFSYYLNSTSVTGTPFMVLSGSTIAISGGLDVTGISSLATTTITSSTISYLNATNVTSTYATITNATLTNLASLNLSATNIAATNIQSTNATSTNLGILGLFSYANASGVSLTSTNLYTPGLSFTNATGTNLYLSGPGNSLNIANNANINGTLSVGTVSSTNYIGNAQNLSLARIGQSTYSTIQHLQDIFHSSGWVAGGVIADIGAGNVSVAGGTGLIRGQNQATTTLYYFDWTASSSITIAVNTIRYLGVEYNGGSPQVALRTTGNWNYKTDFPLGRVVNENGTLYISNDVQGVGDHAANMILREYETMPLARDERNGGLMLGETGTRNITMTAGALWDRLNRYPISAINTGVSGNFDIYVGATLSSSTQTQWPNAYFDNAGVRTVMTNNRYANLWFFVEMDGRLVMVYGTNQYSSAAAAQAETMPVTLPDRLISDGKLIGRIVFLKNAATATTVDSAFDMALSVSQATNHANLSNLDYASSNHTGFQAAITTGNTAQYFRGDLSLATLNQAAIAGLTITDSPTFFGVSTTNATTTNFLTTNATSTNLNILGLFSYANANGTSLTSTNLYTPGLSFVNANGTSLTSTNIFTSLFNATNGNFTNVTTTNLSVATRLSFVNATGTNITSTNIYNSNRFVSMGDVMIGTTTPGRSLVVSKDQANPTGINISNKTNGAASNAGLFLSNDTGNDDGQLFKYASGNIGYKTLAGSDLGFYNAVGGNISILNDYASGNINFAAGAVSSPQLIILPTGLVGIGTAAPSSTLHVVGNGIFSGILTSTSFVATRATTTNLAVTTGLSLPNTSVTDAMISSAATWNAKLDSSYSALATSTFLNQSYTALATSTFLSLTGGTLTGGLNFTNATGTNLNLTGLFNFVNATGTSITSTNATFSSSIKLSYIASCNASNQALQTAADGSVSCGTLTVGGGGGGGVNTSTAGYFTYYSGATSVTGTPYMSNVGNTIAFTTNTSFTTSSFSGSIGVGTTNPTSKLHVYDGTLSVDNPVHPRLITTYSEGTISDATHLIVSGKYAYITDYNNNSLTIMDISNPASMQLVGRTASASKLLNANYVYVAGKYAYVVAYGVNGLAVVDVSDPGAPTTSGFVSDPTLLSQPDKVYVSGRYAYVSSNGNNGLTIVDISNPKKPTIAGSISDATNLGGISGVYVVGHYAYVTFGWAPGGMSIIDVANPASPVVVGHTEHPYYFKGPFSIYVSGKYAYVTTKDSNGLAVVNISSSTAPTTTGFTSSTYLKAAVDVQVSGNYAYVGSYGVVGGGIAVVDVSNPAAPTTTGGYTSASVGNLNSISVSGKYAYVVARWSNWISSFDLEGANISTANIGNVAASDLTVWENAEIGNNLYVGSGLNVGLNGISTMGQLNVFSTTTLLGQVKIGTTTALSTAMLHVDAGTSTAYGLAINGFARATGGFFASTSLDLAERYPVDPNCEANGNCPTAGDVICQVENTSSLYIEKCSVTSSPMALGIVSTDPGFVLEGGFAESNSRKIALAGRVPVRVSTANGNIKPGDLLAPSGISGIAIKATEPGVTVGRALENYNQSTVNGFIIAYVQLGWNHVENKTINNSASSTSTISSSLFESIIDAFRQFGIIIEQGILRVTNFFANKVTTDELCVGNTCVNETQLIELLNKNNMTPTAPAPAVTPVVDTSTPAETTSSTAPVIDTTTVINSSTTTQPTDTATDTGTTQPVDPVVTPPAETVSPPSTETTPVVPIETAPTPVIDVAPAPSSEPAPAAL